MGTHIEVVAGLIARDGRLLICQRRHDTAFPLKWEFPGGKVKSGESPEAALQRELAEELDVRAGIGSLLFEHTHSYAEPKLDVHIRFYEVKLAGPAPRNLEFADVQWVAPEQLPRFDFLEGDLPIVRALAAGQVKMSGEGVVRRD